MQRSGLLGCKLVLEAEFTADVADSPVEEECGTIIGCAMEAESTPTGVALAADP